MIIQCVNCNKNFEVDSSLIPENGRNIQCGSCDHIWFYRHIKINTKPNNPIDNSKNDKMDISPILEKKTIVAKDMSSTKKQSIDMQNLDQLSKTNNAPELSVSNNFNLGTSMDIYYWVSLKLNKMISVSYSQNYIMQSKVNGSFLFLIPEKNSDFDIRNTGYNMLNNSFGLYPLGTPFANVCSEPSSAAALILEADIPVTPSASGSLSPAEITWILSLNS